MCGIAGYIDLEGIAPGAGELVLMTDAMVHRGPDAEGLCERGRMHFGHRRLSIIDLTTGSQPMSNEDGSVWIVFNGEIYDYQALRRLLVERGHTFKSHSDTETIIHAYEEFGEDCVDWLRGQFAFAIWDERQNRLFVARDRLGQKPLYYHYAPGERFVFASTLTALTQHPSVPRSLSMAGVDSFLQMSYVPEGLCILEGIHKLPPAHWASITCDGLATRRYWTPPFARPINTNTDQALEQLDHLLGDATRMRMVADVPVGAFLSGGIDSTLVVAAMRRAISGDIHTFSIGFEDEQFDERRYAREVARKFDTIHEEFVVTPNATTDLAKIASYFDEPFADSSSFAVYYLSELTRRHVKVVLNGDGGDESFGGYERYWGLHSLNRLRSLPDIVVKNLIAAARLAANTPLKSYTSVRRMVDWASALKLSNGDIYQRTVELSFDHRVHLTNAFAPTQAWNDVARLVNECTARHVVNQAMFADQMTYLPGDLLVKIDRMTMAHGLEGRSPFLDHKLVEFAAQLPDRIKLGRGPKHLLKRLLANYMPANFINRKKQGFGVPIANWFKTDVKPLLREWTENSLLVRDGIVDPQSVFSLRDDHWNGKRDNSRALWTFVNLELWYANSFTPSTR